MKERKKGTWKRCFQKLLIQLTDWTIKQPNSKSNQNAKLLYFTNYMHLVRWEYKDA